MCEFRSYVVSKTEVFSLDTSNSHDDIFTYYRLADDRLVPRRFVRVEMCPCYLHSGDIDLLDAQNWHLEVDGTDYDFIPDWFDYKEVAARVWDALSKDLQKPYHWCAATQTLPAKDMPEYQFLYVIKHLHAVNQVVTPDMEPDHYRRLKYAKKYTQALVDSNPPPTVLEEPFESIRSVWALRSKYPRVKPPTVTEEPCEYIRREACTYGRYVDELNMPTFEEEPSIYCRVDYLMTQERLLSCPNGQPAKLLNGELVVSLNRIRTRYDGLTRYLNSCRNSAATVTEKLVEIYDMIQAANAHLGIQPMPEDYKQRLLSAKY